MKVKKIRKIQNSKAFTLVELMIIVVILAILATVGFISYEDYLVDARDSKRLSQMQNLRDTLRLYITRGSLPLPSENVELQSNFNTFAYQGNADRNVLDAISHDENVADPLDESYYTYYLAKNRRDFQLLGYLEKQPENSLVQYSSAYANDLDYASRFPKVFGKELGIIISQEDLTPLQFIPKYKNQGYINLNTDTGSLLTVIIKDGNTLQGEGEDLIGLTPFSTCNTIYKKDPIKYGKNGTYTINPTGGKPLLVYCDMGEDDVGQGGGWTLAGFIAGVGGNSGVFSGQGPEKYRYDLSISTSGGYGLDVSKIPHAESFVMFSDSAKLTQDHIDNNDLFHLKISDFKNNPYIDNRKGGHGVSGRFGFTGSFVKMYSHRSPDCCVLFRKQKGWLRSGVQIWDTNGLTFPKREMECRYDTAFYDESFSCEHYNSENVYRWITGNGWYYVR